MSIYRHIFLILEKMNCPILDIYLCLYLDILDRRIFISICEHFHISSIHIDSTPKTEKGTDKNPLEISLPVPFIKSWFTRPAFLTINLFDYNQKSH